MILIPQLRARGYGFPTKTKKGLHLRIYPPRETGIDEPEHFILFLDDVARVDGGSVKSFKIYEDFPVEANGVEEKPEVRGRVQSRR